MTCIVGLCDAGRVIIGGDAAGTNDDGQITLRRDPKVWKDGDWSFGFTSSFRMGQLLRYAVDLPVPPESANLDRFMVTTFIDTVRDAFHDGGYMKIENNVQSAGTFLVAYRHHLYCVEEDFQIGRSHDDYLAVGTGADAAMGSLHSTGRGKWSARQRVRMALEAAAHHTTTVAGPFTVLST